MLQILFVMLTITAGQLFGAAVSEDHATDERFAKRVDTFDSVVHWLPTAVQNLPIYYLPNSKLDRLRVTLRALGTPADASIAPMVAREGYKYVAQTAPVVPSPLKVATIGQILNANPFKGEHLPTNRKWLHLCAGGNGISDVKQHGFTDAATELLQAACQNSRSMQAAEEYLPGFSTEDERIELGVLFGEIEPRRMDQITANRLGTNPDMIAVCRIQ
jgi:hypothetical protein